MTSPTRRSRASPRAPTKSTGAYRRPCGLTDICTWAVYLDHLRLDDEERHFFRLTTYPSFLPTFFCRVSVSKWFLWHNDISAKCTDFRQFSEISSNSGVLLWKFQWKNVAVWKKSASVCENPENHRNFASCAKCTFWVRNSAEVWKACRFRKYLNWNF